VGERSISSALETSLNSDDRKQCLNEHGVRWFSKILDRLDEWHTLEDGRFELA